MGSRLGHTLPTQKQSVQSQMLVGELVWRGVASVTLILHTIIDGIEEKNLQDAGGRAGVAWSRLGHADIAHHHRRYRRKKSAKPACTFEGWVCRTASRTVTV